MNLNRQFPRYFISVFHVLSLNLTLLSMLSNARPLYSFVDVRWFTWKKGTFHFFSDPPRWMSRFLPPHFFVGTLWSFCRSLWKRIPTSCLLRVLIHRGGGVGIKMERPKIIQFLWVFFFPTGSFGAWTELHGLEVKPSRIVHIRSEGIV